MIKAKHYLFTIMILIDAVLFSTIVIAADTCSCESDNDCGPGRYCTDITACCSDTFICPLAYGWGLCRNCQMENETCSTSNDCCPNAQNCVGIIAGTGHCCPERWMWNGASCQAPAANPCEANGHSAAGDNYCADLLLNKNKCCGNPGSGHCEECCSPEVAHEDCGFCEYCSITGGIDNWECVNQMGTDIKDDCSSTLVCNGLGDCSLSATVSCYCTNRVECEPGFCFMLGAQCTSGSGGICLDCPEEGLPEPSIGTCSSCNSFANPDLFLSNGYCCPAGEIWDGTSCSFCRSTSNAHYACANEHTGGIASCTCGGRCYSHVSIYLPNGSIYLDQILNCEPDARCVTYNPDYLLDPDMPSSLKVCNICEYSATCCVAEGGAATLPSECCAGLYLNGTHCCQKGWSWNSLVGACEEHDSCFRAGSYPSYCNYHAPNSPLYNFLDPWFTTHPQCIDNSLNPMRACCYMASGLYGFVAGDDFYYWHVTNSIVLY